MQPTHNVFFLKFVGCRHLRGQQQIWLPNCVWRKGWQNLYLALVRRPISTSGSYEFCIVLYKIEQTSIYQCLKIDFRYLQVGQLYLSNLPIQGVLPVSSNGKDPGEIWLAIDSYVLNLKVWNRTSQVFVMEQQPSKNIK